MRVTDVAEFYAEAGGGVKTYIDAKLRAGTELGHEMTIVAPGREDREEMRLGGRIIWLKSPAVPGDRRYGWFHSRRRLHGVLDRIRPDVVEASSPFGGAWMAASWRYARKYNWIFHQDPVAALLHPLLDRFVSRTHIDGWALPIWAYLRRLGAQFDSTIVASAWLAERLTAFGLPRVTPIPFGIDPRPFWAARADPGLRAHWLHRAGLGSEAQLLVAVSRHHPEKRLPVVIDAVGRLEPPAALVIFGDGPARSQVERAAARYRHIVLAGYTKDREQLARIVASADAFVHGSAAETYGLVIAEALAARTPLVLPRGGGAAELADPSYAETYRPGDAEDCARAIRRLLQRAPSELGPAVAAGSKKVRTLDEHFKELFGYYSQQIGGATDQSRVSNR